MCVWGGGGGECERDTLHCCSNYVRSTVQNNKGQYSVTCIKRPPMSQASVIS